MSTLLKFYGEYDQPQPAHYGGNAEKISTDVVVVGSGGAGLASAVRLAQHGKKVLLIEKMQVLGGNTRLAGGFLATNSEYLAKRGVPDTTEEHIDAYRRHNMYTLDEKIFTKYLRNTGKAFDWLVDLGLDIENTRIVMDKVVMIQERSEPGPLRNPAYGPGLMGTAVTGTLIKALETYGVTVLTETKVTELLTSGKSVIGLKAVGQGNDYEVKCKNMILATGGFGCDNELLKRFFPQYFSSSNYFTHYSLAHCTGDGLRMAEKIGAQTGKFMSIGLESMVHMPGEYTLQLVSKRPEGILVSDTGKRFMPEDDMDNGEFILDKQPMGEAWYLVNEETLPKIYKIASENGRYGDWIPEIELLYEDIEKELKNGLTKKGNTIQELAGQIGAPAELLKDTLEKYRKSCETGMDTEYHKAAEYLLPMSEEGPWYAIRITRKFDVTMGGISINENMQALRDNGAIIPGLYVCGDLASGWMGEDYGPLFSSFAWSVNSGYLAAEEICK